MSRPARATGAVCDCGCNHLLLAQIGPQINVGARACACGVERHHTATVAMSDGHTLTMPLGSEMQFAVAEAYRGLVAAGLIRFGGR